VQRLITVAPLLVAPVLSVTGLRDTAVAVPVAIGVFSVVALLWAIEPVTNLLFLAGRTGRLVLDAAQRRSALLFAAFFGSASLLAPLALVADRPGMVLLTSVGLALMALALGGSQNMNRPLLHPLLEYGAAAVIACAAVAAVAAVAGASIAELGLVVLFAGTGALWVVRLG
jgi:hypothetical protein